jgi:hypothetical protein
LADASGGACIVANKPPVPEEAAKGDSGRSYLPPWMRGKELASTDPDAPADLAGPSSGATDIAEPRKQAVQRSYRRRVVERRWERERRRTYRRNDDWAPKGWPGQ